MTEKKDFIQTIGRRKTAVAVVKLFPKGKGEILINEKKFEEYFKDNFVFRKNVLSPLEITENLGKFKIEVLVSGGGKSAQSEAIRLGISRALVELNPELKPKLKAAGFLKRDPRAKERKKFGLKRARRAPQWQKR
jgi:small subunit ribosomal protein S9